MTRPTAHPLNRGATWVVAADHGRARLFCAPVPGAPLQEVQAFLNPAARQPEQELAGDRPGRVVKGRGGPSRSLGQHETPKEHAAERFAEVISQRLRQARQGGALNKLYLIAEPGFLGLLRQHLDEATSALIAGSVDKDVTEESVEELRSLLPDSL
jgi:protein required for attachment to host cells